MPPPSRENKKWTPDAKQVREASKCTHENAYRSQPRQLTRQECIDREVSYGTAETQWLCPKCTGVFYGDAKPVSGTVPNEYDHD